MHLDCLIVEDEPMARKLLAQYIDKTPGLELAAALASPLTALDFLKKQQPKVLFLDIQMPEITGIDLLKIIQHKPTVVLTTAYSEYALEGYELDVTDYLLKPITFERFIKTAEKIKQIAGLATSPLLTAAVAENSADYLFVKDGTKSVRVDIGQIQYIEGLRDYVRIHTPDKKITTLQSLKKLTAILPAAEFVRIHHSFIVALKWVEEVHRDEVLIAKTLLSVSDTYRGDLRQAIMDRMLK